MYVSVHGPGASLSLIHICYTGLPPTLFNTYFHDMLRTWKFKVTPGMQLILTTNSLL